VGGGWPVVPDRDIRHPVVVLTLPGCLLGAALFGITLAWPCPGVVLTLVVMPTYGRAALAISERRSAGEPMTLGKQVWAFLTQFGVVFLVLSAVFGAFIAACYFITRPLD
jgi:hypothetical protein